MADALRMCSPAMGTYHPWSRLSASHSTRKEEATSSTASVFSWVKGRPCPSRQQTRPASACCHVSKCMQESGRMGAERLIHCSLAHRAAKREPGGSQTPRRSGGTGAGVLMGTRDDVNRVVFVGARGRGRFGAKSENSKRNRHVAHAMTEKRAGGTLTAVILPQASASSPTASEHHDDVNKVKKLSSSSGKACSSATPLSPPPPPPPPPPSPGSNVDSAMGKPASGKKGPSDSPSLSLFTTGLGSDALDLDVVLRDNGLVSTRRTKLICTIGPPTCSTEQLEALAVCGMNVARLNMCHNTHECHGLVIDRVRELNRKNGYGVAVMMDTKGSEIHMGDLREPSIKTMIGDVWTFTVRQINGPPPPPNTVMVNYDGFVDDVLVGDGIVVDGGMSRFEVVRKNGPDVIATCTDSGLLLPRGNLTFWRNGELVRGTNAVLPTLTSKDWKDIDFGICKGVDVISISFVRSAEVIANVKSYIQSKSSQRPIAVFAKIESIDSLPCLEDIIRAADGVMVERRDLGAQIALEQVPGVQQQVINLCRQLNKPVIVASQLLESMMQYPAPTRAEVADISEAVRQRADALMLSGESAIGSFPIKAVKVLEAVARRTEEAYMKGKDDENRGLHHMRRMANLPCDQISEEVCMGATEIANRLEVQAVVVWTKTGYIASLLSRCRPNCPVFVFTDSQIVRQRLNLHWGLSPFRLQLSEDMEMNVKRAFALLQKRGFMKKGEMVVMVSDLCQQGQKEILQSVQIRRVS
ncbi:hypothetical protein CBR_g3803 [Chara braunii]|uniref:Pyruvate kinase n=1 Tax=Chara braunii TaxID=69332 RepID=A0A388KGD1_CHABU|nr:hypothetical protein CBR_g3803 [Chara braunii]|eukprot:GBG69105.1 hypothetical protein CBR_g3803 [Chara braunii]